MSPDPNCDDGIVITGGGGFSNRNLPGDGGTSRNPGFAPDGGGDGGSSGAEDKACSILEEDSDSTKSVLPRYVTDNKNWHNARTLEGYKNYYQIIADEWAVLASTPAKLTIAAAGAAFSASPLGRALSVPFKVGGNIARLGAPQVATVGLNEFIRSEMQLNIDKVNAIDARLDVIDTGC